MVEVPIKTASKEYPLFIGNDAIYSLSDVIDGLTPRVSSVFIISEETVAELYLEEVRTNLQDSIPVYHYVVPSGEASKSFENYYECQTFALQSGLDRNSIILALGGGVIGDLAGFVAATYMRGIRFIQVPTTLLAHDSAVGGKVAVNHPLGKNIIGAFHQPEAVIYHLPFLATLPVEEWRSGYGEVIKHAYLSGEEFLSWLEKEVSTLDDLKDEKLLHVLKEGINVKAQIVAKDEKESNVRAFLNFGHTLGHAIESELGYGKITHGDAVAIGMVFALRMSEHVYGKDLNVSRLQALLERFDYPTIDCSLDAHRLMEKMKKDKKSYEHTIHMVLMKELGQMEVRKVNDEDVLRVLTTFIKGE
ncbi:3-dehydroquinate synthase [Priestia taiwanensis]|uniref:3-dehydroquinate synthase n=1 Tax=Priestia taiwanensis TaxID=1347902 RepID=A0A917EL58_9BACI|nr:3-dehydroquinate synthase [Priestia taiwanensis]MBM7361708.1 3-dehydroquinate synthase [Priestia taiwanensis]GGE56362.1 3-dehydroquinate synthase [Priestia taiwanensis]